MNEMAEEWQEMKDDRGCWLGMDKMAVKEGFCSLCGRDEPTAISNGKLLLGCRRCPYIVSSMA